MVKYRLVNEEDAPEISRIYRPYVEDTAISFELIPPDADEILRRITNTIKRYPYIVAEFDGRVVGYAYASEYRKRKAYRFCAELSVYVDKPFCNQGVGRGLYKRLLALLVEQGIQTVYAAITLPNENSVGLHKSLGFSEVGVFKNAGYKLDGVRHVLWMELSIGDGDYSREPTPFCGADEKRTMDALEAQ